MDFVYKSFCWHLGTTSFRTKNFNKSIELQLGYLEEFWKDSKNKNASWASNSNLQSRYYDFLHQKQFITGHASKKDKDAREKTSGLVELGLVDNGRRLTNAGDELLRISETGNFETDNIFQIQRDSFVYLKQLLKTHCDVSVDRVRPFIVFLYVLSKVNYLTEEEFAYLLPLCTNKYTTEQIIEGILLYRKKEKSINSIILNRLMTMDNYNEALFYFQNVLTVDENVICDIGINRKSRGYDKAYYPIYLILHDIYIDRKNNWVRLLNEISKIRLKSLWMDFFFSSNKVSLIEKNPLLYVKPNLFDDVKSESDFRKMFFMTLHLLKAKSMLMDYLDLNRRYFSITDVMMFEDGVIKLSTIPKYLFNSVIDKLYESAYQDCDFLYDNCDLRKINYSLVFDEKTVIEGVNKEFNINVETMREVNRVIKDVRYKQFEKLLESKFTNDKLLLLLDYFEDRNDAEIQRMVSDNADIPTIFEYILGIIWYKISDKKGDILEYMKLSLDADLLPKTHAAGGEADIVYEYADCDDYPAHTMLLEATLTDNINQRRSEMEPVSRHLGMHLVRNKQREAYCVFITNHLDSNVVSDFRLRKYAYFYDPKDNNNFVLGLKIIPLETKVLKQLLIKNVKYSCWYKKTNAAFKLDDVSYEWYKQNISSIAQNP